MTETRLTEVLLAALVGCLWFALAKERKRLRVLSHFVFGIVYFSVNTASRLAPAGEMAKPEAYLNSLLEDISVAVERDSRLPWAEPFIDHYGRLFEGEGFPELYREFHRYFSGRWNSAKAEHR